MAIEFRDVTQLEPLEALEDGDYLVVVRDGVAKRISKADAKFGGGTVTTFYLKAEEGKSGSRRVDFPSDVTLYTDAACTQAATSQQVIDAFSAGGVRILRTVSGAEVAMTALSLVHQSSSGSGPAASLLVANPDINEVMALNLVG